MIADEDIVDTIYTMVYNTGLVYDNCDKRDDKQRDKKTWANFQAQFQTDQRKYKKNRKYQPALGISPSEKPERNGWDARCPH